MKKSSKKLIVFLSCVLAVAFVAAFAFLLYEEPAPDEEILSAARELVPDTALINEIFYGGGIPHLTEGGEGNYFPADSEYLSQHGIVNTETLKEMTRKVYSTGVCETIFSTKLSSVMDSGYVAGYAEYIDFGDTGISVYSKREDYINAESVEYDLDSLEIVKKKARSARVSVDVILTKGEETQTREKEFNMVKTKDGEWYLDSMTYIAWVEETPDGEAK